MEYKILKAGQTGTGILIENDAGFISPDEPRNKAFINEIKKLESDKLVISEPLVVYVVLQKYGVKNRNGRIYPETILKKQNELYQQVIKERRAVGECVPAGTEVMTINGWKNIEEMKIGDEIFTLNLSTNKIETQAITDTIKKSYNDEIVHIHNSRTLDMKLTKNHKMILWDRYDVSYEMTAIEFYKAIKDNDSRVSHSTIKYGGIWEGKNDEKFIIPNTDIEIDIKLWAAFLGIFISEGHTSGSCGGKIRNSVTISQTKSKEKQKLIELLDLLPFKYTISNNRQFNIYNKDLYNHLSVLGNSHNKFIPEYAKNWKPEILEILFKWLLIGDGRNRHNEKGELLREYYTTSERLANDVYELILKLGNGASINKRRQKDRYITDISFIDKEIENDGELLLIKEKIKTKRLIKADNSKLIYIISEKKSSSITLDKRYTKVELEKFNDDVFCVSVPNKTWLMRYNNKSAWTHNCDHPESSIISADRIATNIIETWWEDRTLMGKMEILMTPGFIKYGICSSKGDDVANLLRNRIMIGVSSRGVGSLKEINGSQIVQDDFEMICWDVVTAPSTPGSWITSSHQTAQQFVENIDIKKDILKEGLNESLDSFLKNYKK